MVDMELIRNKNQYITKMISSANEFCGYNICNPKEINNKYIISTARQSTGCAEVVVFVKADVVLGRS